MISLTRVIDDKDFALEFYDYVCDLASKILPNEDKIILILNYKKWDLIILKEIIENIEKQIKIAASNDLHEIVDFLWYKKYKFEREFYEILKERLKVVFSLLIKNYLLKKA